MIQPRRWTPEVLSAGAAASRVAFRKERLDEPLQRYSQFFEEFCPVFRGLIEQLPALRQDEAMVAQVLANPRTRTAFRYLGAPPISEDDLKTLADCRLSSTALRTNLDEARRVRDTVLHIIDPHRFPWVRDARSPDSAEQERAVVASAALVDAKRVETLRRSTAKKTQETKVNELLHAAGFTQVARRVVAIIDDAPGPGEFCCESQLGETRADLVVRLRDRRVMAIECKVSNSAVNSFKRVNHEAANKAQHWLTQFGQRSLVPAAVLAGVFKAANLVAAQEVGLFLFWQHRLDDLEAFLRAARD